MPDVHRQDAIDDAGPARGGWPCLIGPNQAWWGVSVHRGRPNPVAPRVSALERLSGSEPLPAERPSGEHLSRTEDPAAGPATMPPDDQRN